MKTMKKMNVTELKSLSRTEMKNIMAGSGGACLTDYTYDCSSNSACCSNKCERNGTNTGTLCMP